MKVQVFCSEAYQYFTVSTGASGPSACPSCGKVHEVAFPHTDSFGNDFDSPSSFPMSNSSVTGLVYS